MKTYALPIRFGIITSVTLITYFLILSLFSLHTNVFYSLFNAVITGYGIYGAIRYVKLTDNNFTYQKGFVSGIITGFIATLLFTFFFAFYATEINTGFLKELSEVWFKNYKTSAGILFFTVAIMGFATTVVLSLSFIPLFKVSNNLKHKVV